MMSKYDRNYGKYPRTNVEPGNQLFLISDASGLGFCTQTRKIGKALAVIFSLNQQVLLPINRAPPTLTM
jgi:hypothetical protein